jgi:hypothetical protein
MVKIYNCFEFLNEFYFLAIKVFREIGHPGMVMTLEEIKVKLCRFRKENVY